MLALLNELIKISHSHIFRLDYLFKKINVPQQSATCETMNGLIRKNLWLITHSYDSFQREYGILNFLQHVNNYKITAYNWLDYYLADQQIHTHYITEYIIREENRITKCIAKAENSILGSENPEEQLHCL